MSGRPRKPLARKRLSGRHPGKDSGDRPLPKEPAYAPMLPKPPAILEGVGLAEWNRLGPKMVAEGVLTEADWAVFFQYCDAVQRRLKITKVLAQEKMGTEEWHALDRALDRVEKQLTTAIRENALSTVTRSKASLQKPKEVDPMEKFKRPNLVAFKGGKK